MKPNQTLDRKQPISLFKSALVKFGSIQQQGSKQTKTKSKPEIKLISGFVFSLVDAAIRQTQHSSRI